jgi:GNAT superfamily N-acetyltransferase
MERRMAGIRVVEVGPEEAAVVFGLVAVLLRELGEEGDEAGDMQAAALASAWRQGSSGHRAFVAYLAEGTAVGVATVTEAFAVYANGFYGIINEMFVVPEHRSAGIGAALIEAVKALALSRGWRRIDVTAPESPRWARTRGFYEREGFVFTGPKLKFLL